MSFLMKNDESLKTYKIWKKFKNTMDKTFDSDPAYN